MRRERDQAHKSRERTSRATRTVKKNRWAIDDTGILARRADVQQPSRNAAPADAVAATRLEKQGCPPVRTTAPTTDIGGPSQPRLTSALH